MNINALLVNFTDYDVSQALKSLLEAKQFPCPVGLANDAESALEILKTNVVAPFVIFFNDMQDSVAEILRTHQTHIGPLSEFQAIVCSEPSPYFMAAVFEYGVEQFLSQDSWMVDFEQLCKLSSEKLGDETSAEFKTLQLAVAAQSGDSEQIQKARDAVGDLVSYDYRAAYTSGKASEASGNFNDALEAYRQASGMSRMFRPSNTSLGEACLITGRIDEAISIFQKLERSNPRDIERKSSLASAYIEKGDFEMAAKYAAEAEAIAPGSSRIAEIKAQVLMSQGNVQAAFGMLDQMSNVGPFFAAKLNDLGIKLSQAGKGKSALALYQKAHKAVRSDLRYKISLNAALACRRLQDYDLALKYVTRCAKEYGALFPKLARIREALLKEKASHALNAGNDGMGKKDNDQVG